jgi:hypothetical protein
MKGSLARLGAAVEDKQDRDERVRVEPVTSSEKSAKSKK